MFDRGKTYEQQRAEAKANKKAAIEAALALAYEIVNGDSKSDAEFEKLADAIFAVEKTAEALGELDTNWFVQMSANNAVRYLVDGYSQLALTELFNFRIAGYEIDATKVAYDQLTTALRKSDERLSDWGNK